MPAFRRAVPRWAGAIASMTALASLAAGCGSSSQDDSTSKAADSTASAAVVRARAAVRQYQQTGEAITLPALSKPAPRNLRVDYVTPTIPVAEAATKGLQAAAKTLGWRLHLVPFQMTPEGYASAWSRAVDDPVDAVAYVGTFPDAGIAKQLGQLQAKKVPAFVMVSDDKAPKGAVKAVFNGPAQFAVTGRLWGDIVGADANGAGAHGVYVTDPSLGSIFAPLRASFDGELRATCPKCSFDTLNVSSAGPAGSIAAALVSYLQRKPDTRYVVVTLADFLAGVPQALKAAGLAGKVKIIARQPSAANLANLRNGDEYAEVVEEQGTLGWRGVDAMSRVLVGDPLTGCCDQPAGWHRILMRANVPADGQVPTPPGDPAAFLKAWGQAG